MIKLQELNLFLKTGLPKFKQNIQHKIQDSVSIIGFFDRFKAPLQSTQYRDINIVLELEIDQFICEIQLHLPAIYSFKSSEEGTKLYNESRELWRQKISILEDNNISNKEEKILEIDRFLEILNIKTAQLFSQAWRKDRIK